MIDTQSPNRPKLAPILCALCGHPVSHTDPTTARALAGGQCTRCKRDKDGRVNRVFTFIRYVERDDGTARP